MPNNCSNYVNVSYTNDDLSFTDQPLLSTLPYLIHCATNTNSEPFTAGVTRGGFSLDINLLDSNQNIIQPKIQPLSASPDYSCLSAYTKSDSCFEHSYYSVVVPVTTIVPPPADIFKNLNAIRLDVHDITSSSCSCDDLISELLPVFNNCIVIDDRNPNQCNTQTKVSLLSNLNNDDEIALLFQDSTSSYNTYQTYIYAYEDKLEFIVVDCTKKIGFDAIVSYLGPSGEALQLMELPREVNYGMMSNSICGMSNTSGGECAGALTITQAQQESQFGNFGIGNTVLSCNNGQCPNFSQCQNLIYQDGREFGVPADCNISLTNDSQSNTFYTQVNLVPFHNVQSVTISEEQTIASVQCCVCHNATCFLAAQPCEINSSHI